jgi:hypothetical protein
MSPALFTLIGTAFAFAAAGFWLWSAATRFPDPRGRHETVLEDMQLRSRALRLQSRRNAFAALCAAGAAALQAAGVLMQSFGAG